MPFVKTTEVNRSVTVSGLLVKKTPTTAGNKLRSSLLLMFAICFTFVEGLSQSLEKSLFEKKIKQEINLVYKPFYTFANSKHIQGNYHPVKLRIPITHTYEVTYGIVIKHLKIELFGKDGTTKYNLLQTEAFDSLNISYSHFAPLISDTFKFYSGGFRIGRAENIGKRFQYEALFGLKFELKKPNRTYHLMWKEALVLIYDNTGKIVDSYARDRFFAEVGSYTSKILGYANLTFRMQYKLFDNFYFNAVTSFEFFPASLFVKDYPIYDVHYFFYDLRGKPHTQISEGRVYSNSTQLHLGIGVSYFF